MNIARRNPEEIVALAGVAPRCPLLGTILVVDSDEESRSLLRVILEGHGFSVQEARDATEALQKAATLKESLAVLVTDAVMPRMSGAALAHVLRKTYPSLPVLFISGYPAGGQLHQLFEQSTFLQKPFSRPALIAAVCAELRCPAVKSGRSCI